MNFGLNNSLTASRTNCFLRCQRQHFWACEIGLHKNQVSFALRFGTAWANAMEARWKGEPYSIIEGEEVTGGALYHAQKDGTLDEYGCATVAALLAAYYEYYGPIEEEGRFLPEVQFVHPLGHGFTAEGKLDARGKLKSGQHAIIENKTTGESLEPDSIYWDRLKFNVQLCQYVIASKLEGLPIEKVFYDVTRKPSIKPKMIADLDEQGRKIVLDSEGNRVFNTRKVLLNPERKKGKGGEKAQYQVEPDLEDPKQSSDKAKGYFLKEHLETADEFCDRLYRDALSRPAFYFARREVPILPAMLEQFEVQRNSVAQQIKFLRSLEANYGDRIASDPSDRGKSFEYWLDNRDPEVWTRNVSKDTCNFCSFRGFCLQNYHIDLKQLPEHYELRRFNPELNYDTATEDAAEASAE